MKDRFLLVSFFFFPPGFVNPYHTSFKQYIPLGTKDLNIPLNTCICSTETLLNLGKLHVNAIQSPVHYYKIYKKNFIVAMGLESGTYVLNHNFSVVLPYFITLT